MGVRGGECECRRGRDLDVCERCFDFMWVGLVLGLVVDVEGSEEVGVVEMVMMEETDQ